MSVEFPNFHASLLSASVWHRRAGDETGESARLVQTHLLLRFFSLVRILSLVTSHPADPLQSKQMMLDTSKDAQAFCVLRTTARGEPPRT